MTILLICPPDFGHIKNFIVIAQLYIELGHDVTLVTSNIHPQLKIPIKLNVVVVKVEFWYSQSLIGRSSASLSVLLQRDNIIKKCISDFCNFESKIKVDSFDFVFVDRFFSHLLLLYPKVMHKARIINTMMSCYKSSCNPPLDSQLYPGIRYSGIRFRLEWIRHSFFSRVAMCKLYPIHPWYVLLKIASYKNIKIDRNNLLMSGSSSLHFGIRSIPEYCTGFRAFDFTCRDGTAVKNSRYLGINHLYETKNIDNDSKLWSAIAKAKKSGQKIIYVGFGTIHGDNKKDIIRVVRSTVAALKQKSGWFAIISGASSWFDEVNIENVENIYAANFVAQAELLKYSDVFVCHGGLSSIFEGVESKTPMIIIPFYSSWDIIGNSARVEYHKIGVVISKSITSPKTMVKSISFLLSDNETAKRVHKLNAEITDEKNMSIQNVKEMLHIHN